MCADGLTHTWRHYDQTWVSSAPSVDLDYMVPLAEAWDSGGAAWPACGMATPTDALPHLGNDTSSITHT